MTDETLSGGTATAATAGAQGFDSDTAIDHGTAEALFAAGFRFAVRYLSRTTPQNPGDLGATEAATILGAGLALMAVQHCPRSGWAPSAALGRSYGVAAATNAQTIGLPPQITLWFDLEGVAAYATAADTIAHVNNWAGAVAAAGYQPGVYVGANQPLTGEELYWRLRVQRYWRSASIVPDISYRGYCMAQALAPTPIATGTAGAIAIDRDVTLADNFGGLPQWLAPAPAAIFARHAS
ncbi:MAG: glycoside hydrolase domain-containing protein [Stellaceae bacterium]